ncbi:hypothetical protein TWF192_003037 [Orbilia oligospora]|uniref:Uncharacterized protein n=1 Tax=Orbilia oligospora TaxID=2813651 RepID=A0A6G1MFL2_ORBOL|nr:hypothetical protein TWF191_008209 [Orbilia oligospora]KAF3254956.1 hypothetical protein TWF192_003037 [Orbilia oligospora]
MAICIDSSPNDLSYGMLSEDVRNDPRCIYDTFDSDFYKCLCEDLAKELDFPDQTDLRRISQLELFGSSWETDPYKKLLLRCLDHSIPRLREPLTPRSHGGSIDYTAMDTSLDFNCEEEATTIPTNPPPSPALSAVNYVLSGEKTADKGDDDRLEPLFFDKLNLLSPAEVGDGYEGDNDDDDEEDAYNGLAAGEIAGARRIRRQQTRMQTKHQYHRRVASTGLLATVVTSDGSIIWHFKEFS